MNEPRQYKVFWTDTAKEDLIRIIEYIAIDSPSSAKKTAIKIRQKAEKLETLPLRGRWVPELQDVGIFIYREMLEKPWRIIYRIEQETVHVTAVLDSRRDLGSLLLERLLR